jgi:hypothetical protein
MQERIGVAADFTCASFFVLELEFSTGTWYSFFVLLLCFDHQKYSSLYDCTPDVRVLYAFFVFSSFFSSLLFQLASGCGRMKGEALG